MKNAAKDTSLLRFCKSLNDLILTASDEPALLPNMTEIIAFSTNKNALSEFNAQRAYLSSLTFPANRSAPGQLGDGGVEWVEYLDMQLGLTAGVEDASEFQPLTWLALTEFLQRHGTPYPRKLLATVEYFLSDWDPAAFLRLAALPEDASRLVLALSETAREWLSTLTFEDVY